MNNYIDERIISYRRPYRTSTIIKTTKSTKGNKVISLAKKVVLAAAKVLAVIFLLVISTFSGVSKSADKNKNEVSLKRATKNFALCVLGVLAVWGALVCFDSIVNYATLMPVWFFIGGFALVGLSLGKFVSR